MSIVSIVNEDGARQWCWIVSCGKCGSSLTFQVSFNSKSEEIDIDVDPCRSCLAEAEKTGDEAGYEDGFEKGRDQGFEAGEYEGEKSGYEKGEKSGYEKGIKAGFEKADEQGYMTPKDIEKCKDKDL